MFVKLFLNIFPIVFFFIINFPLIIFSIFPFSSTLTVIREYFRKASFFPIYPILFFSWTFLSILFFFFLFLSYQGVFSQSSCLTWIVNSHFFLNFHQLFYPPVFLKHYRDQGVFSQWIFLTYIVNPFCLLNVHQFLYPPGFLKHYHDQGVFSQSSCQTSNPILFVSLTFIHFPTLLLSSNITVTREYFRKISA